jgi:hypothetical protein
MTGNSPIVASLQGYDERRSASPTNGEASALTIVGERRSHTRTRASIWRISIQTIAPNFREWCDA